MKIRRALAPGSTRPAKSRHVATTLTLLLTLFGLSATPALAQEVTFSFSGTVDLILPRGTLPAHVTEGDVVTGRFTFDSGALGNFGGPGTEVYFAACRVEAEIEDLVFGGEERMTGQPGGILVRDAAEGASNDGYTIQFQTEGEISSFILNLLASPDSDAIVGTELPLVPPDPALFATGSRTILVSLGEDFGFAQLSVGDAENFGELTVAEVPLPCPEPGTPGMLVACMALVAMRGRRCRPAARIGRSASQNAQTDY